MQRIFFVLILASSALHAASFTSATATCAVGTTTQTATGSISASCSIPLYAGPAGEEVGFAGADALISGSLSSGLFAGAGGGFAAEGGPFPPGLDVTGSGDATANYSQTFTTAGPERPGFISCLANGFGGLWGAGVTQGGFNFCGNNGPPSLWPLILGEPFQVFLSAEGGGGGTFPCYICAGDSSASLTLYLITEADGATGVSYFAVATPEPTTWGLFCSGSPGAAWFRLVLGGRTTNALCTSHTAFQHEVG